MKAVKLFVKNTHNEIRRVDKLSGGVIEKFPKNTDYARRLLLCTQLQKPYFPYELKLNEDEFREFQIKIGDGTKGKYYVPKGLYSIVNDRGLTMLVVELNNQKENGEDTGISKETE